MTHLPWWDGKRTIPTWHGHGWNVAESQELDGKDLGADAPLIVPRNVDGGQGIGRIGQTERNITCLGCAWKWGIPQNWHSKREMARNQGIFGHPIFGQTHVNKFALNHCYEALSKYNLWPYFRDQSSQTHCSVAISWGNWRYSVACNVGFQKRTPSSCGGVFRFGAAYHRPVARTSKGLWGQGPGLQCSLGPLKRQNFQSWCHVVPSMSCGLTQRFGKQNFQRFGNKIPRKSQIFFWELLHPIQQCPSWINDNTTSLFSFAGMMLHIRDIIPK